MLKVKLQTLKRDRRVCKSNSFTHIAAIVSGTKVISSTASQSLLKLLHHACLPRTAGVPSHLTPHTSTPHPPYTLKTNYCSICRKQHGIALTPFHDKYLEIDIRHLLPISLSSLIHCIQIASYSHCDAN